MVGQMMAVGGRAQGRLKARPRRAIHSLLHTAPCPTCALTSVRVLVIASLSHTHTHSHDTRGRIIATLPQTAAAMAAAEEALEVRRSPAPRDRYTSRLASPVHSLCGSVDALAGVTVCVGTFGVVTLTSQFQVVSCTPLALLAWHHPAPSLRRKLVRMAAHNKAKVVCGAPSCSARGCALCRTHLLSLK